MIFIPCILKSHSKFRLLISSHIWNILEELSLSAYLFSTLVVAWYFSSREGNLLMTMPLIIIVSISTCFISYIIALPFYLFVERPFKNFLNLIVFPNRSIFQKKKRVDDSEEEDAGDDSSKNNVNLDPKSEESNKRLVKNSIIGNTASINRDRFASAFMSPMPSKCSSC